MENQKRKLIFSVFTATMVLLSFIFSLVTYAWYSHNDEVYTLDLGVSVSPQSDIKFDDLVILKREGADKAKDVSKDSKKITMSEYDAVFTDKNVNTPIIIKARLNIPNAQVNHQTISGSMYWLKRKDWKYLDQNDNTYKFTNLLSNITCVRCAIANDAMLEVVDRAELEPSYVKPPTYIEGLTYYSFDEELGQYLKIDNPQPAYYQSYFIQQMVKSNNPDYDELFTESVKYLENTSVCEKQAFVKVAYENQTYRLDSKDDSIEYIFDYNDYQNYLDNENNIVLLIEINYDEDILGVYSIINGIQLGDSESSDELEIISFEGDLSHFLFQEVK